MVRRARWIYPAVIGVLVVVYYATPGAQDVIVTAVGAGAVLTVLAAAGAYRPIRWRAWWCLAGGILFVAVGEVAFNIQATGGGIDPFPSGPDVLYLSAYPLLSVGLLWLGLARYPSRDLPGWIETTALTLAGALLMWIALITPTVRSLHLTGMGKALMVASWIADVIVLATAVRLVTVWARTRAAWLLCGAVIVLLAGDVAYGMDLVAGRWRAGGLADLGLLAFFALAGAAALDPSMAAIGSDSIRRVRPTGLVALAVALLVAPSALVVEATSGPVRTPYAVAFVSAAVGGLVWWRMALAIGSHRRTTAREAEIRHAARQLALALDTETVTGILATVLANLAGPSTAVHLGEDGASSAPNGDNTARLPVTVDHGRVTFVAPPAELAELEDTLIGLAAQADIALERIELVDALAAGRQQQAMLAHQAAHDPLTGLANADTFRQRLHATHTSGGAGAVGVLFLDLDDFKTINDTLGHDAGDTILVATADAIRGCLRQEDLGARLGGDEFAVLLVDPAGPSAAEHIAERIIASLQNPTLISGLPVVSQASIGIAVAGRPEEHDTLLRHADAALYAAKAAGKGRWMRYQPGMVTPLHPAGGTNSDLHRLVDPRGTLTPGGSDGLALHYQPIVNLTTGKVFGYEALIRWHPPHGAPVAAQSLINAAERAGLMPLIGDWVFRQALTDLPHLPPTDQPSYLSINVSASQLRRGNFLDHLREHLPTARGRLILEITENQPLADDDPTWRHLHQLRDLGLRIAIDDYGTGHASLAYLRHPGIDIIKLDHSFLTNPDDPRTDILLTAVITLSQRLALTLISEGIDNDTTRRHLINLECRLGQGHLIAPAMPLQDLQTWTPPEWQ